MPLRGNYTGGASPALPSSTTTTDDTGPSTLRRLLGGGIRAISGAMSAGGWATGGPIISGVGELGAELAEGSDVSAKRIGAEATLGAIPFGAVLKAGRPLASAIRGAVYAGGGEALREAARGEDIDPASAMKAAAGGGVLTGALAKLFGGGGAAARAASRFEVEPTAVHGGQTLGPSGKGIVNTISPGRIKGDIGTPQWENPRVAAPPAHPPDVTEWEILNGSGSEPTSYVPPTTFNTKVEPPAVGGGFYGGGAGRSQARGVKESIRLARDAAKTEKEARAVTEIETLRTQGVEPKVSPVVESISAETPAGRERITKTWKPEDEEGGGEGAAKPLTPKQEADAYRDSLYRKHVAEGKSPLTAWKLASKGVEPGGGTEPTAGPVVAPRPSGGPSGAPPAAASKGLEKLHEMLNTWMSRPGATAESLAAPTGVDKLEAQLVERYGEDMSQWPAHLRQGGTYREPGVEDPLKGMDPRIFKPAAEVPLAEAAPISRAAQQSELRSFLEGKTPRGGARKEWSGEIPTTPEPDVRPAEWDSYPPEVQAELDRLGPAYRSAQGAEKRGLGARMFELKKQYGPGAARPSRGAEPVPPAEFYGEPAAAPPAPEGFEAQATRSIELGQKLKDAGVPPQDIPAAIEEIEKRTGKFGSETGAVDPAFLAAIARTGLGALAGGVVGGAAGHPLLGAAVGGAAGAFAPAAISRAMSHLSEAGTPPSIVEALPDSLQKEGIQSTAKKVWQTLPQIQRFNYLFDVVGLPANALAGPYGSAVMAALEHGLSGDERGWMALRKLTPQRFLEEFRTSIEEAQNLIAQGDAGRGETIFNKPFNIGGTEIKNPVQIPGIAMTTGDVAARRILKEAGFSEEEARRITLTSEPEAPFFQATAEFGKKSPLAQLLFPFRRTPSNIGEQGLQRTPLLGFLVQAARENPDPARQQAIQQIISLVSGGAGYEAGENLDPETAKVVRRFLSNFGGQYSLPVSVGFAAGQSAQAGQPALSKATATGVSEALPLPTTTTITDWTKFLSGGGPLPRGVFPLQQFLMPRQTAAIPPIPPLR